MHLDVATPYTSTCFGFELNSGILPRLYIFILVSTFYSYLCTFRIVAEVELGNCIFPIEDFQ